MMMMRGKDAAIYPRQTFQPSMGLSLAFTILRRGTWNSAPIFYLSLIARIYQYALTLPILLQEAQLNHTTGLA